MIHGEVSDRVCTLRLDAPPLNTLTLPLLGELLNAIRQAEQNPEVQGIVLTGGPDRFSAGVDIGIFQEIHSAEDAVRLVRTFQQAFQAIEDCSKPIVATLTGQVMGGALELAMACHLRIADRKCRFSMPEVRLGINPGAGGTQRLPRLVGPSLALEMLLSAESIDAQAALAEGLIDEVCEASSILSRAQALARSLPATRPTRLYEEKVRNGEANCRALDEAERRVVQARPEILAPRAILDAVRAGLERSFEAGQVQEQHGFAACAGSRAAQNKIYLFFATRQAAKVPELATVASPPIRKVAVVGMGTMGTGIVQALLLAGLKVVALDESQEALDRGREKARQSLARRVEQGKLTPEEQDRLLSLLSLANRWEEIADADLVVEAVFEDPAVKERVFARMEEVCRPDAILASNTSTLSLDELAKRMRHPERFVGTHFFNPAHRMPLLEIIRPAAASPQTLAAAMGLARSLRKTPVLVKNREGFVVSRLFVPYLKEAFWLLEEGAKPQAIDRAMVEFGFPMGPLALIDMAGLDILALTDRVLRRAFPQHGALPPLAAGLVERGQLGQKTGAGVYRYAKDDYTPRCSEEAEDLLAEIRRSRGLSPREVPPDEITQRLLLRMVAEAYAILEEGIVQRASDLDVAVVLGIGFPDFRGGVVRYAEELGLSRVVRDLEALAGRCGERFAPCSFLRQQGVGDGGTRA